MQKNINFLNFIYQNAEFGIINIDNVIEKIQDIDFKNLIRDIREDYLNLSKDTIKLFTKFGQKEEELGKLTKINSYLSTSFKTITDHSTSNIAKTLIESINKGTIEITKALNDNTDIDEEARALGDKLQYLESVNVEKLKEYL